MSGVRGTKGRAAALRRLWSWPLRRPRNLIILVIGVVVVVAGASRGAIALTTDGGDGHQHEHAARPAATAPAAPPSASSTPPSPAPSSEAPPAVGTPPPPPSSSTPPQEHRLSATQVAARWARAFEAHAGKSQQQWLAGLTPYSTPELSTNELATVNPANVPGDRVTGTPTVTEHRAKDRHVRVPTNGNDLALVVVETRHGWKVIDYQPARKAG
jgi:hypothetical protein